MKALLLVLVLTVQFAVAKADTIFNCSVTDSKIAKLKTGNKFQLSLAVDKVLGTPISTVTALSLDLNGAQVGAMPEVTSGEDTAYTLSMPDGSQLGFFLRFKTRNQSPAVLIFNGSVKAKLSCQIIN